MTNHSSISKLGTACIDYIHCHYPISMAPLPISTDRSPSMSMELRPIYLEPELPERNGDYNISSIGPHYDLRLPAFEEGSTRVWANDATSQSNIAFTGAQNVPQNEASFPENSTFSPRFQPSYAESESVNPATNDWLSEMLQQMDRIPPHNEANSQHPPEGDDVSPWNESPVGHIPGLTVTVPTRQNSYNSIPELAYTVPHTSYSNNGVQESGYYLSGPQIVDPSDADEPIATRTDDRARWEAAYSKPPTERAALEATAPSPLSYDSPLYSSTSSRASSTVPYNAPISPTRPVASCPSPLSMTPTSPIAGYSSPLPDTMPANVLQPRPKFPNISTATANHLSPTWTPRSAFPSPVSMLFRSLPCSPTYHKTSFHPRETSFASRLRYSLPEDDLASVPLRCCSRSSTPVEEALARYQTPIQLPVLLGRRPTDITRPSSSPPLLASQPRKGGGKKRTREEETKSDADLQPSAKKRKKNPVSATTEAVPQGTVRAKKQARKPRGMSSASSVATSPSPITPFPITPSPTTPSLATPPVTPSSSNLSHKPPTPSTSSPTLLPMAPVVPSSQLPPGYISPTELAASLFPNEAPMKPVSHLMSPHPLDQQCELLASTGTRASVNVNLDRSLASPVVRLHKRKAEGEEAEVHERPIKRQRTDDTGHCLQERIPGWEG